MIQMLVVLAEVMPLLLAVIGFYVLLHFLTRS